MKMNPGIGQTIHHHLLYSSYLAGGIVNFLIIKNGKSIMKNIFSIIPISAKVGSLSSSSFLSSVPVRFRG